MLIHQAFATPQDPGGTRHYELSRYLVKRNHRVTIIASTVNYLTGQAVRPACGRWIVREQSDKISICRAWTYSALHRSYLSRTLSFLSFMLSSLISALHIRKVDIVWGTSPPLFQALTAYVVARSRRIPFVLEVRDLWPDFAIETGVLRSKSLIQASRMLERFFYRHADRVVANSPGFLPHLKRCGVPEEKLELVPNGVEVTMFNPLERGETIRQELALEGKFIVLYTGAHGLANGLETLLLAAEKFNDNPDIVFVLVGDGKERPNLMRQAKTLEIHNVRFVPAQPKARIPLFLAAADCCVAILKPVPMFATTCPNKVFDYMAAGRPTILAIDGVIRGILEAAGGGTFVEPGNASALAEAIRGYYQNAPLRYQHGQNARTYVASEFSRADQGLKLQSVFERVYQEWNAAATTAL